MSISFYEHEGPPGSRQFSFWTFLWANPRCDRKSCTWSEPGYSDFCCRSCAETGTHPEQCDVAHARALTRRKDRLEVGDKFVGYPGPFGTVIEVLPNDEYLLERVYHPDEKVNLFNEEGDGWKDFRIKPDGTTTIRSILKPARQLRCVVGAMPVSI